MRTSHSSGWITGSRSLLSPSIQLLDLVPCPAATPSKQGQDRNPSLSQGVCCSAHDNTDMWRLTPHRRCAAILTAQPTEIGDPISRVNDGCPGQTYISFLSMWKHTDVNAEMLFWVGRKWEEIYHRTIDFDIAYRSHKIIFNPCLSSSQITKLTKVREGRRQCHCGRNNR